MGGETNKMEKVYEKEWTKQDWADYPDISFYADSKDLLRAMAEKGFYCCFEI